MTEWPNRSQALRVLDMGTFITGPAAGMLLADLGAEVIKVEQPGTGDPFRAFRAGSMRRTSRPTTATRSRSLNTKKPEDLAALDELVEGADVFIQNFRPGVAERLKVDAARLQGINPRWSMPPSRASAATGRSGPPGVRHVSAGRTGFLRLLVNPSTRAWSARRSAMR
jgi:crotonobetainyl-CoA:carnitine CoA-transferase CaiB-like acyl-CoA transferase